MLVLALVTASTATLPAQAPLGSYELRVCAMECRATETTRIEASGLVILDRELSLDDKRSSPLRRALHDRARRYFENEQGHGINGCFSIARTTPPEETFVGIMRNGFTGWRLDHDGTLRFALYYSPDASYDVTLRRSGDEWVGRGVSVSSITQLTGLSAPQEFVAIRRTGAPAPDRCFSAPEDFEEPAN